jgi:hypothetical protein
MDPISECILMNRTSVLFPVDRVYTASTLVKCQCELFPNCKCFYVNTSGNYQRPVQVDTGGLVQHNHQVTRNIGINLNILYVGAKWHCRRVRVATFSTKEQPFSDPVGPWTWKTRLLPAIPGLFFKDLYYYQHRSGFR